jgi:hypothetical protein
MRCGRKRNQTEGILIPAPATVKHRPFKSDAFARKQKQEMAKQKAPNARRAIVEE